MVAVVAMVEALPQVATAVLRVRATEPHRPQEAVATMAPQVLHPISSSKHPHPRYEGTTVHPVLVALAS